jgi:hypothetical protein
MGDRRLARLTPQDPPEDAIERLAELAREMQREGR